MMIVEQMLAKYPAVTQQDKAHALREIMQEIALAGLYRGGFFEKAAFYGGTCLRIFYGLERFSEDLDFSLLKPEMEFSLEPYFKAIKREFNALGLSVDIQLKVKTNESAIDSVFLKNTSEIYDLRVDGAKTIKIKFEVDRDPPMGFLTEEKLLLQPFSFYTKCFSLSDLFAGKMHALLFRQWKNRVKGRDWYDFEWYVRRGVKLNLSHFCQRAKQSGDMAVADFSHAELLLLLREKIQELDIDLARQDVVRFIKEPDQLNIWSKDYFSQLVDRIKIELD